jgi:2-polyprenyl-3-methyl-5-hydroxy-6-metoxy-1,4-benzoquinol methylase
MWSQPAPTPAELQEVYRATYRNIRQESATADYLAFMDMRARAQYEFITRATARSFAGLRVLDIGCGAGSLLKKFESHGAAVTGFEPDCLMCETARGRLMADARVENALFSWQDWRGESFDLVCMSHVLEHVPDPVDFLAGLYKITRPEGYLFIEVPNEMVESVQFLCQYRLQGLMHLVFFNEATLRAALKAGTWKLIYSAAYGQNMSDWVASLRRNYSVCRRAIRKARRMLGKTGLISIAARPPELQIDSFTKANPRGEYLRTVAQKPGTITKVPTHS